MWNGLQCYARQRSHSFSGPTPATHEYTRVASPAFLSPYSNHETFQRPISSVPVSPVIPQHSYEPPLPRTDWDDRGRSRERDIDLSKGDVKMHTHHSHHSDHSQEPVYVSAQHQERHPNKLHKHRHGHHHRPSSHGQTPNITVHANGQIYTVPSRPAHQRTTNAPAPVYAQAAVSFPQIRPPHSAQQVHHTHGAVIPHSYPAPQMSMPNLQSLPKEIIYYGPSIGNKRHYFQYSQCSRQKKALCIGINYIGHHKQLNGCINDARRMRSALIKHYGFKSGDIVLLTDEGKSQRESPTKRNITDAMKWLVKGAQAHDSLVLHFSGHGGQTKDVDGGEIDGRDEAIFPLDWKKAGHIVDDDMHKIMVRPLPVGCRLTAVFDCCHSGSVLDLPYIYGTSGKLKRGHLLDRAAGEDTFGDRSFVEPQFSMDNLSRELDNIRAVGNARTRKKDRVKIKTSPADVICWAGCKDSQTSADTWQNDEATGAMSYAFMSTLKAKPDQTYQELLINVRKILKNRFSQEPQLSASHPIDTSLKFVM